MAIVEGMLGKLHYKLSPDARQALSEYIPIRRGQLHFANARSMRNAIDRARLRQANRCLEATAEIDLEALVTIEAEDFRRSRVFAQAG